MTTHEQNQIMQSEIQRLKQDYLSRQRAKRPLSHSIAVAYRQVIAAYERNKRDLDRAK